MKKSERLNQELIFLKDKKSFQLRDLIDGFAISKRTALRDIAELEALGVPLYTETGRLGGYRVLSHTLSIPVYFTDEEITAILFALQSLQNLTTTPFDKSYRQIYDKLWAALSPHQQEELRHRLAHVAYSSIPSVTASPQLKKIFSAAGKRVLWQLQYHQKKAETLTVYIHQLFFQAGVWYFKGYEVSKNRWYILRCDCVESCRPLAQEQAPAFPFADEAAIERSLSQAQVRQKTLPFTCRLTAAGREHFLKNDFYHMKLQPEAEGTYRLTGTIDPADLPYLIDYFISFGRGLRVLGPENVVAAYKQALREMMEG
ncbi:helix-turn-helix transcriptional regulator [Acidaminococcus fermentans]|uniref:helix-turn-helix transcriptional regulator n=1 Tax=Acidaminococcus fermentans TaxID=905 RepID=UPI002E786971|nr:WYL domain-containing protein [Acidaminococcus fermentans]MEE0338552.1 WYL domain-containing protein [Acidaminococcus fermentans]